MLSCDHPEGEALIRPVVTLWRYRRGMQTGPRKMLPRLLGQVLRAEEVAFTPANAKLPPSDSVHDSPSGSGVGGKRRSSSYYRSQFTIDVSVASVVQVSVSSPPSRESLLVSPS